MNYINKLENCEELFWTNPGYVSCGDGGQPNGEKIVSIDDAEARLLRFAPFIRRMFPEVTDGIIESPLTEIPGVAQDMGIKGRLFLKQDSHLPISGSVKARGGIYEVLKLAEELAQGRFENYEELGSPEMREFYSQY